jgi:hypothetical protein
MDARIFPQTNPFSSVRSSARNPLSKPLAISRDLQKQR